MPSLRRIALPVAALLSVVGVLAAAAVVAWSWQAGTSERARLRFELELREAEATVLAQRAGFQRQELVRRLAASEAQRLADVDGVRALLLAVEAARLTSVLNGDLVDAQHTLTTVLRSVGGVPLGGGAGARVSAVALSDGLHAFAGTVEGDVLLWRLDEPWEPVDVLPGRGGVEDLVSFGGRLIAAFHEGGLVRIIDARSVPGRLVVRHEFEGATAWSADVARRVVAFGRPDGVVTQFSVDRPERAELLVHAGEPVMSLAVVGGAGVAGTLSGATFVWRDGVVHTMAPEEGAWRSLAVGPTGAPLVAVDARGSVTTRDDIDPTPRLVDLPTPALDARLAPDGRSAVVLLEDGAIVTIDAPTGRSTAWWPSTGNPRVVAFSADGRYLATDGEGGSVLLRIGGPHVPPRRLASGPAAVTALGFATDGGWLISGALDGSVRLWPLGGMEAVPDGAATGTDAMAVAWSEDPLPPDLEGWTRLACLVAGRELTRAEWRELWVDEPYRRTCDGIDPPDVALPDEPRSPSVDEAIVVRRLIGAVSEGVTMRAETRREVRMHVGALVALLLENDLDGEVSAGTWNLLCWQGSLAGLQEAVMAACERAVAVAPDDGNVRDSRGLARALAGDLAGALQDFEAFVAWAETSGTGLVPPEVVDRRRSWIESLRQGSVPFDAVTLEALRRE